MGLTRLCETRGDLGRKSMTTRSMMPILALAASLLAVGCPAYAFDLNGAWATDAAVCDKVFVKKDNKVSFAHEFRRIRRRLHRRGKPASWPDAELQHQVEEG